MSKPSYKELSQKVKALEKLELKLRESEEKFRLAFHTNPDSINLNLASDGKYIDINEGFTRLMGYTREDAIGKTSLELNIWVDSEDRRRLLDRLMNAGSVENLEARFRRKNGEIRIGLMSARILSINQENVILSITHEITERKIAEQALSDSEKRYRTLFERSNDAIFIIEKKTGRHMDANNAALQLTGYPLPELCKLTTYDVCPEGAEVRNAVFSLSDEPENLGRRTYVRPDGSKRIALFNTVPLDDEKIFGIAHDITDEVNLEEQFLQAQKMEAIGLLAGGMAHDFNNLLVPIIGYTELCMMKLCSDDNLYSELEQIKTAAERAASLIQQILAFSRKQMLEMRVLDFNEIVRSFQKMIQRLIKENIKLHIHLSSSPGHIKADKAQIEQVLMNLVINATDAMPAGGDLTIETADLFLDKSYFKRYPGEKNPGHYIMLAVSDTGHGMDAETQKHIFEPFFTTKKRGKGTGLGLATVFGIINQHQGHIWVYSELGRGTSIKVYLPQSEDKARPVFESEVEPVSVYGTETVLVVEDEAMVRNLVCETLAAYGYNIIEACSPAEGLQIASECGDTIHLLLADVIMPEMNGPELYKRLADMRSGLKVLYMSGYTDNVIVHHGVINEGVNFLQKPFTINNLTRKVRMILG